MHHGILVLVLFVLGTMAFMPGGSLAVQENSEDHIMTLNACIETALEKNPRLTEVSQEKAIQVEEISLAKSAFLPHVDALAGYTRFQHPMRVIQPHANNEPGVFDKDLLETGVWLRLPLYQGGKYSAELSLAELGRQRTVQIWKNTRQDLILNIYAVFYKILQLDEIQRSVNSSIQALEAHKQRTDLKLKLGRAAPVDVMKIDVRLAEIQQQLSAIRGDRTVLLARLAQFMGMEISNGRSFDIRGDLIVDPAPLPDLNSSRRIAENQRPELTAARLDMDRAKQGIKVARAAMLPHVDGIGTYGLRSGINYDEENEDSWAAGLQATVPLYHGGAINAKIRKAKIQKQQAKERILAVRLQIETDLQQAMAHLTDSIKRIEVNNKNMATSSEIFRIEEAKNKDGKSSINDLLDAQYAMLLAEVANSQSIMDYLLARIEWRRGVGEPLWSTPATQKE